MIGYLKGKILNLTADCALIETGGVGYEVQLSGSAMQNISGRSEGEVYTYMQVREDGISLFGFSTLQEKDMFLKLITVSGVGPKMGVTVLSGMNAKELTTAIATADVKKLSSVKGLGKKTAERIILELREKISAGAITVEKSGESVITPRISAGDEDAEVALMSLGFTRAESAKAVARAKEQGANSVEDILMLALKGM